MRRYAGLLLGGAAMLFAGVAAGCHAHVHAPHPRPIHRPVAPVYGVVVQPRPHVVHEHRRARHRHGGDRHHLHDAYCRH